MAVLTSPGVSISVIDQSINIGAGPGTVPLIFVATRQDKTIPGETAVAQGTTQANAGKLWSITSQRDLVQTFGDPTFYEVSGSSLNGYPLNEYGLLAAYSYLGVSNLVRVVRADVNTAELVPTTNEPSSPVAAGTYWFDESSSGSSYGLFIRSGVAPNEVWSPVTINYKYNFATGTNNAPPNTAGSNGQYAVVFQTASGNISYWVKKFNAWTQIGTNSFNTTGGSSLGNVITVASTNQLEVGMVPRVTTGTGFFDASTRVTAITSSTTFTVSIAPLTPLVGAGVSAAYQTTVASIWPDLNDPIIASTYWIKASSPAQGANIVLRRMSATTGTFVQVESPILGSDANANTYYNSNALGSTQKVYLFPIATGTVSYQHVNGRVSISIYTYFGVKP